MHHPSPSAITYPSSPQPYYRPHSPTTSPCSTTPCSTTHLTASPPAHDLLHPARLPTSLPHHLPLPYSTQLYYRPHYPTTCTCPTPPSSTTHLTTLPPAHDLLHPSLLPISLPYTCTRPTPLLGYLSQIRYPTYVHTAPYPLLRSHLLQYYPAHRTHVPHSTPPSPSPPQMYHATYIL